jgi:oxygen-dependent protoporphyrinogen oxidase
VARVAIVGGGIAGLSAAWELQGAGAEVVVVDAARIGGKLQASEVPGLAFPVDEGADAFLARVPDALELCAELGIDDLVHPAARGAWIWSSGRLHPLPQGQLLGLPTDVEEIEASGLLSADGVARLRADLERDAAPVDADLAIGALVRARLGDEVCDRLVEPLVGGINGGEADALSVEACVPQLWACARQGGSLVRAAQAMRAAGPGSDSPVFATPTAGMAALPQRLVERLAARPPGLDTVVGRPVTGLSTAAGHRVELSVGGRALDGGPFDGVVLAVPADVAGALVAGLAPEAAAVLASTEFASVAMVTVVADRRAIAHPLDGSGFVAARDAGLDITAASFASTKWAHWDDGEHAVFRISLGHDADPVDWCAKADDELAEVAVRDLGTVLGEPVTPVGVRVGRWPRAFPQYRPGHVPRLTEVRAALHAAGPIALAGMSYDGIGVPACVRSGRIAARHLLA